MIVSINLNNLHSRDLIDYYWIDLDDKGIAFKGKKTFGGSPTMEFTENSGLRRIADEYRETPEIKQSLALGRLIYHFELIDRNKFFMSCMKWGMVEGEDFELLDISEEEVLKFAHPPDTLPYLKLDRYK